MAIHILSSSASSGAQVEIEGAAQHVAALSSWKPDFTQSNPYAGMPLNYAQQVQQTYLPTPTNPLNPIQIAALQGQVPIANPLVSTLSPQQQQILGVNSLTALTPQQVTALTTQPTIIASAVSPTQTLAATTTTAIGATTPWKPDFTKPNPYEGMPPEYAALVGQTYVPTASNPLNPLQLAAMQGQIPSSPGLMTLSPQQQQLLGVQSVANLTSLQVQSIIAGKGFITPEAAAASQVSTFKPDFTQANPYLGVDLSYIQREMAGYVPTAANPLPPTLQFLKDNPDARLTGVAEGVSPKPFTQTEFDKYQSASPDQKFKMLMDKGYIPKGSEYAGVDGTGKILYNTPEAILRGQVVDAWNKRVIELQTQQQVAERAFQEQLKDAPKPLQDAYAAGGIKGYLETVATAQRSLQNYVVGVNDKGEATYDYVLAVRQGHGNDVALLFGLQTMLKAQDIIAAQDKLNAYLVKPAGGIGPPSGLVDIQKLVQEHPTQDTVQLLKTLQFPADIVAGIQQYVDATNKTQAELSRLIASDRDWSSQQHPDADAIQRAAEASNIPGLRVVMGMTIMRAGEMRSWWGGLTDAQKAEISGRFAADPIANKGFASSVYSMNQAIAKYPYTIGLVAGLPMAGVTPIVNSTSGIPVTQQEWAIGGASIALTAIGLGGGAVLSSIGTGGRVVNTTIMLGSGAVFTKQTVDDWGTLRKNPVQATMAIGMDALLLAGGFGSLKGMSGKPPAESIDAISKAAVSKGVDINITTRIGETISDIKTTISGIPNKVMTAPEAIKYYTEGLGLKAEQIVKVVQRDMLEVTREQARDIAQSIKMQEYLAGKTFADLKQTVLTTPEAIKYYMESLKLNATQVADLAKKGLLNVTERTADSIAGAVERGETLASNLTKRVMTAPEAIRYYTAELGMTAEQVASVIKRGLLEVTPEIAREIARNELESLKQARDMFTSSGNQTVMSTPEAIKFYSEEGTLMASQIAELSKKGLLNVPVDTARQVIKAIKNASLRLGDKAVDATKVVLSAPEAVRYYAGELKLSASELIELAKKNIGKVTKAEAEGIVAKIRAAGNKIVNLPDAVEYYTKELTDWEIRSTNKLAENLSNDIKGTLNEIYTAMKAKDARTVIERAHRLEQLAGDVSDQTISDYLKTRAQDIAKNASDYVKMADELPKQDIPKVEEGVKQTEAASKETLNKLLGETRPLEEADIATTTPEMPAGEFLVKGTREFKAGEDVEYQKNLETLDRHLRNTAIQDVDTYLKAQQAKSANIPKLEKLGEQMTLQDLETYLKALQDRAKTLQGLDKQVADATIRDLSEYVVNHKALQEFKEVMPEEGTLPHAPLNMEQVNLLLEIARDNRTLSELKEANADPLHIMRLAERINQNMQKLDALRPEEAAATTFTEALKKLGYTEQQIKDMVSTERFRSALDARLKQLGYSDEQIAKMKNETEKLNALAERDRGEPPAGAEGAPREPTPSEPERGGGVATLEKVKTETKPMTPEEIERLMKEKEAAPAPEEKVAPKTEAEAKPATETKVEAPAKTVTEAPAEPKTEAVPKKEIGVAPETERQVFLPSPEQAGEGVWALVWEGGRLHYAFVVPDPLQHGYIEVDHETGKILVPQTEYARMTPEQVQRLYGTQIETGERVSAEQRALVAGAPIVQAQPATEAAKAVPTPAPAPAAAELPTPTPAEEPKPVPTPRPEPAPAPEEKRGTPIPVTVLTDTGKGLPPVDITTMPEEWKAKGVPPGTLEWRQGVKWGVLPPPYRDEDKMWLDKPLPGTYKFAVGKGSAYKTLQVIGGPPPNDADIDMGWAQVHISSKGKELTMAFEGGDVAANERWDLERAYMQELDRQSYYGIPAGASYSERIRGGAGYAAAPAELSLNKQLLPEFSNENIKVYSVNGEYIRTKFADKSIGDRNGIDFTQGGHYYVYWKLIPENEVWIEESLQDVDRTGTIVHELQEREDMMKGMEYTDAHNERANPIEVEARQNPERGMSIIRSQLAKYGNVPPQRDMGRLPAARMPRGRRQIVYEDPYNLPSRRYFGRRLRPADLGINI